MLKDSNYIVIQGWMVSKLNLKGVPLLLYSIIYGFSQDDDSNFHGGLQYLQNWTNSSRQAVIAALKTLIELNLIIKESSFPNNKYFINKNILKDLHCKDFLQDSKQILQDSKDNLQNNININNNIINNNNNTSSNTLDKQNKYIQNNEIQNEIDKVVKYMNEVCRTSFKSSTNVTKKVIKARLNEGYKFNDFKDVIDFKYKQWGVVPVKFSDGQLSSSYLRPSTLFGNKFESYLQAAWLDESKSNKVESVEKSKDRSKLKF